MRIPLAAGANQLTIAAVDSSGRMVGTAKTVQVTFTGAAEPPERSLVINEIMYRPSVEGGEFVELHNTSASNAFDLSGWIVNGLDFTLPPGTILEPGGFMVIARDPTVFWEAYGPDVVPVGLFRGPCRRKAKRFALSGRAA